MFFWAQQNLGENKRNWEHCSRMTPDGYGPASGPA